MIQRFLWIHLLVIVPLGLILLLCLGMHADAILSLLFGWMWFLNRLSTSVRLDFHALITALVCLAGLTLGSHLFLRWLTRGSEPASPTPWRFRSTALLVGLTVVVFAAGISSVGIAHQTGWLLTAPVPGYRYSHGIRDASERMHSSNNLKQLGLAAANYGSTFKDTLPAGTTFDSQGRALHGWTTLLLPYIEKGSLFSQIDLNKPWDDPVHDTVFRNRVNIFLHPAANSWTDADGRALTHYAGNIRLLGGASPPTYKDVGEGAGTSQTLLFGEAGGNFRPWGQPRNLRDPGLGLNRSPDGFGSPSPRILVVQFAFVDGSVRSFKDDTNPEFLALLAGRKP
jgi:Protein of unknown function (DUF1559)